MFDCSIIEGFRDEQRQNEAYSIGKSKAKWPQSKHNQRPSRAVDCIPYPCDWNDLERFHELGGVVQGVAHMLGIKIKWGRGFAKLRDFPHYELEG